MVSDQSMASRVGLPVTSSGYDDISTPFSAPDLFMRRLLHVGSIDMGATAGAHRAFRWSILVTAIRCTILYVIVPILIPVISVARVVAAPVSIALCIFALVNGIVSVRRFWTANHPARWKYLAFMGIVFVVLLVSIFIDVTTLVSR
jgi:hypothetical protein